MNLINAFKEYRKSDRYSVFGIEQVKSIVTDNAVRKRLEDKVTLISKLSPLIAGNLDGNPRQIKRFLNTFVLRKKLADVDLRDYFWISRDRLESMSDAMTPPIVTSIITSLMVKGQAEALIHQKIKRDVLGLQDNLQHELYAQLAKRAAANSTERKQIFNLFEYMIDDSCPCSNEFHTLCSTVSYKRVPALKEIVTRIADSHDELKDLKD